MSAVREQIEKIKETSKFVVLITNNMTSYPQARIMERVESDDGFLWFVSYANSRKIEEINIDPAVTVLYITERGDKATVSGDAEIVEDDETKKRFWRPNWEQYFPEGPTDEGMVLIKITPKFAEYISSTDERGEFHYTAFDLD